jgi:hypothetical protein
MGVSVGSSALKWSKNCFGGKVGSSSVKLSHRICCYKGLLAVADADCDVSF